MYPERLLKTIKILSRDNSVIAGDELSLELGISVRTLRNDLKEYMSRFELDGFIIESVHRKGYRLTIIDDEKFLNFIENEMRLTNEEEIIIPSFPENRINYIIQKLLLSKTPVSQEKLSESLFISTSTINRDLKLVEEKLRYFNLGLRNEHSEGLVIEGSEFHRRSCISMFFFNIDSNPSMIVNNKDIPKLQSDMSRILYETLKETSFRLTDLGFDNLVTHLMIAITRIDNKDQDEIPLDAIKEIEAKNIEIANDIARKIEEAYNLKFPEIERFYIAVHLSGKQSSQHINENLIYMDDLAPIFKDIFKEIESRFGVNLSEDLELYTALAYHFQPMQYRLKFGMKIENPLLDEIKTKNTIAFEMAIVVTDILQKHWKFQLSESEIGYIALHLALSLERRKTSMNKKNVIIVCASGSGSSQILSYRVQQQFKSTLGEVKVSELYNLSNIDLSSFDFMISTVPIEQKIDIPIIYVKYFLSEQDVDKINDVFKPSFDNLDFIDMYYKDSLFFNELDGKTAVEVITNLCHKINEVIPLPDDFIDNVLKREVYAPTEYGNFVAMPHPIKTTPLDTFVAVAILPRSILWHKKMVKYVFLLNVSSESESSLTLFHESLSSLILNQEAMLEFIKNPTLDVLKNTLRILSDSEEIDDLDALFS